MSAIIINNISVNGASAANDIGAASGADTPAKLVTLIDGTDRKIPTDAGTTQAENIVASGLDAIANGSIYGRTTVAGANDANSIATASGLTVAARVADLMDDESSPRLPTADGKAAADAIGAASGATTAAQVATLMDAEAAPRLPSAAEKAALTADYTNLDKIVPTQEAVAQTIRDVNELERTIQQGQGATIDVADIGIVSLDARATGRANPTVEGLTATNLVENGDFSQGGASWGGTNANLLASAKILYVTCTGTQVYGDAYQNIVHTITIGDKMYVLARVRVTNADCSSITLRYSIAGGSTTQVAIQSAPVQNQWYILMGVVTVPTGGASIQIFIRQSYSDTTAATGKVIEIDGHYGVTAINLTSIYGSGNEPSEADCAKIFSYFDGTKSIQLPARIISKSEDETESSTLYIADNEELRSVPAISDEVLVENGAIKKVQNVENVTSAMTPVYSQDAWLTTDGWDGNVSKDVTLGSLRFTRDATQSYTSKYIHNYDKKLCVIRYTTGSDKPFRIRDGSGAEIGSFPSAVGTKKTACLVLDKKVSLNESILISLTSMEIGEWLEIDWIWVGGTSYVAGTGTAQDNGSTFSAINANAQLAIPITTNLITSGTLQAKPKGTVYFEPYYEGSHQTNADGEITLPFTGTVEAVYGYDAQMVEYLLDPSEYSLVGTTLTITGALLNEVFYVELSRTEPLAPEMNVNVLNNLVVPTTVNAATYTVLDGDHTLLVAYTPTGTCAITIPSALIANYVRLTIKDSGGSANTNNITISTEGSEKIDGADTYVINTAKGKVELASDGSNLYVVG